ncbi:tail fiber domain-containing protein [Arthrobacter sp. Y81]|uniref:tail fiber domain-containing protein n=1 Tax=Arthrobacter sp. Y81 TaxID=2058897 RepID=UPI0015E3AD7E|nr:tail fiber domain-containing protein [Arthrobacter sp. Y81]
MAQPGMPGSQFPGEDALIRRVKDLERQMQQFAAANILRTAGISAKPGGIDVTGFINSLRTDGTKGVAMDDDGVFIVYSEDGTSPVARFGPLESAPGEYGVEVLVGSTWVQLGAQAVTWDLIAGKPADFAPLVTSAVADATDAVNAQEAAHALDADGSEYGWTNNVAGTSFYALWVGNDGGFHLGRNVSSIKYKENVTDAAVAPSAVLNLRPVRYDRKPSGPAQEFPGAKGEFGLIAEEVAQHLPEIVTKFEGEIDGVRYDLLAVALLEVVRDQENRLRTLEGREPLPAPTAEKEN